MRPGGEPSDDQQAGDVYDRLLRERVVFVRGPLDDNRANLVVAQLLYLDQQDAAHEIALYINCAEGDLRAAVSIYDAMQLIRPDISTVCIGVAAGGASVLLAAGTRGKRSALPSARIMLHQPRTEIRGTVAEIDVRARELLRLRYQVNEILTRHTGQPLERIERDADGELWLSAQEARDYGIVDEIVTEARRSPGEA